MAKTKTSDDRNLNNTNRLMERLLKNRSVSYFWIFVLLAIYAIASVFVIQTSRSEGFILISGNQIPLRMLTGALSSVANLAIILIVVYFGRLGFIIALVILLVQFPIILMGIVREHIFNNISGLFTNIVTLFAIILIYKRNSSIEKYQKRMREQAATDILTGLPNRFACTEVLNSLIRSGENFAVAILNIRNFKSINSTMGQTTGDAVLKEIANRLVESADKGRSGTQDFVTRQSGDEFALIIRDRKSEADLVKTLEYYQKILEEKMTVENYDFFLTSNIGYAVYPTDAKSGDAVLSAAMEALSYSKRNTTSDRICRYCEESMSLEREMMLEQKVRTALENNTLYYCMQPQYDMSHKLRGFEVLARMKDEDGTPISPADFIPAAEKYGMINKVDYTVFKNAAKFFTELIRKSKRDDITLSVNVSVKHLMKNDFLEEIRSVLNETGLPAQQLEIEITESIVIESFEKAMQVITEFKKMGIKVAIDDFGTGYSSLSYLNSFPGDLLKVDKSFIDKMNSGETSRQYVATIISIGHVLHFDVIAEGVEEEDQIETLRSIGCDYIQGFIWGKPLLPEEAEQLVLSSTSK
ncbi:MAG: EAL domain-containing protein [Solobacterium sp.]|nr:EAL domain-containing protein [Solobacterium sp.]